MKFDIGDRVILSLHLSNGDGGWLWYTDDDDYRHYDIVKLGLVRTPSSWSLSVVVALLLVAVSWRRADD